MFLRVFKINQNVASLIFLSLAGYAALLSIYGSAIAWLIVGSVHLLIAGVAMVTCVYLRSRTRARLGPGRL